MFNSIDRISLDELTPELREIILQSDANYDDIVLSLQSHIQDTTAHVTSEERTYWNNKAPIDSPYFIGTPKAPTPEQGSNSDIIATTKFVTLYIESLDIQNSTTAEKLKKAPKFLHAFFIFLPYTVTCQTGKPHSFTRRSD